MPENARHHSELDPQEFERRLAERRPRFREVPGLGQSSRGRIPGAYEAVDVRREVNEVLYPLWPELGPLTGFDRTADVVCSPVARRASRRSE